MKKHILFVFGFLGLSLTGLATAQAQTTLAVGDLAVVRYSAESNATNVDQFAFVPFVDLSAGTVIRFTDCGWQNSISGFRPRTANEDTLRWTNSTGGTIAAGTVIYININYTAAVGMAATANTGTANASNSFNLQDGGDQIFAFQGSFSSPSLVFGINFDFTDALPWRITDANNDNSSNLPAALNTPTGNLGFSNSERDNGAFEDLRVSTSVAQMRSAILNPLSWYIADTYTNLGVFSLADFTFDEVYEYSVGDIMISGYRSDATQSFSFVTWVSIPNGGVLNFTDYGWRSGTSAFQGIAHSTDGYGSWTNNTGSAVAPGTQIVINLGAGTADLGQWTAYGNTGGTFSIADVDELFVFEGSIRFPNLIYGANWDNGNNQPWSVSPVVDNSNTAQSNLPTVLNATHGNIGFSSRNDNGAYEDYRGAASLSAMKDALASTRAWRRSDNSIVLSSADFDFASAQSFAVGDVMIYAYRSTTNNGFSFITWVDLPNGASLNFTDYGYTSSTNSFIPLGSSTDGWVRWTNTTGSSIVAGSVVSIDLVANAASQGSVSNPVPSGGTMTVNSGDQIFIYEGNLNNPNLIFGLNWDYVNNAVWETNPISNTSTAASNLPSALNVAFGNLGFGARVNNGAYEDVRRAFSLADAKSAVSTARSWTRITAGMAYDLSSYNYSAATAGFSIGDVMISGYRSDADNGFTFVTWVDVPNGTQLVFSDYGYTNATNAFIAHRRDLDGYVVWTNSTGNTLPAGTNVSINLVTGNATMGSIVNTAPIGGTMTIQHGDQIFVFEGNLSNPSLLFGINWDSQDNAAWSVTNAGTASSTQSNLPLSLNVAYGNFGFTSRSDNGKYEDFRAYASMAEYKDAVINVRSWFRSDNTFGLNSQPFVAGSAPQFGLSAAQITAYRSDAPNGFAFVVWEEIPAGSGLNFTDYGWRSSTQDFQSQAGSTDGYIRWNNTTGSPIAPGTVISIDLISNTASQGTVVNSTPIGGTMTIQDGDQIFIYEGPLGAANLLYGIDFDNANTAAWATTAVADNSTNASNLPTTLASAPANMGFTSRLDNGQYTGSRSNNSVSGFKNLVSTTGQWTRSDATQFNPFDLMPFTYVNSIWNGMIWSADVPDATTGAMSFYVENGAYDVTGEVNVGSIILNGGTTLNILPNAIFTVFDTLENTTADINILADSTGYGQYIGHSIDANIQQNFNLPTGRYILMGSPVNSTFGNLLSDWSIVNYAPHNSPSIYTYNGNYVAVPSAATAQTVGNGFTVYGGANAFGTFSPVNTLVEVSGTTQGGVYSVSTSRTTGTSPFGYTGGPDGWNLIANPYPCGVDATEAIEYNAVTDPDFSGAIYGWDGTSYQSRNTLGIGGFSTVRPFQGFWTQQVALGADDFRFNPEMRSGASAPFAKTQAAVPTLTLKTLWKSGYEERCYIAFADGASDLYEERLDGIKFKTSTPGFAHLMSYSSDGQALDINVQNSFASSWAIPVAFDSPESGTYTLSFELENLNSNYSMVLEDLSENVLHPIADGDYSFQHSAGNLLKRFVLHIGTIGLGSDILPQTPSSVESYFANGTLEVDVIRLHQNRQLLVLDAAGRVLHSEVLAPGSYRKSIDASRMSPGLYIVSVEGLRSQKLIVR